MLKKQSSSDKKHHQEVIECWAAATPTITLLSFNLPDKSNFNKPTTTALGD